MKITSSVEPFPHILFGNFYSTCELKNIRRELSILSEFGKPANQTGSALKDGKVLKNNLGIFLPDIYKNLNASSIFKANRKLFAPVLMKEIVEVDFIFNYLPITNEDNILVQFYRGDDYYESHWDKAVYTVIIKVDMPSKKYDGGDLKFTNYNYTVRLKSNEGIMFPSFLNHEVTPVNLKSGNVLDGRITITNFVGVKLGE
jgi:predicted 2-oxoglutarate/Fe(II)-dependent dioxygenase YbiX